MTKERELIRNFRDVFNKMAWLNKEKMENSLKGFMPSEVHCIEAIEKNENPNVKKLAETLYMTRGAISKLTKKLIEKKLIKSYRKQDNKKEIYFQLTKKGREVFIIHEELHQTFQERDKIVFEQVTEEQLDSMLRFVEKYSRHLDAEIKKQGMTIH